jgi:hypothetical protein
MKGGVVNIQRLREVLGIPATHRGALWLDSYEYAARLSGRHPRDLEMSVADSVLALFDTHRLLGPDVVALPGAGFYGPALAELVQAAPNGDAVAALREAWRTSSGGDRLREVVDGVANLVAGTATVALVLPSPSGWLVQAGAEAIDEEAVDSVAMYLAEHLRTFAESRIAAIVLDEGAGAADAATVADLYRPILNLAGHYGWASGICAQSVPNVAALLGTVDFVLQRESSIDDVASHWRAGDAVGGGLSHAWWADGGPLPDDLAAGAFGFGIVPCDVEPEVVLACVQRWRSAAGDA